MSDPAAAGPDQVQSEPSKLGLHNDEIAKRMVDSASDDRIVNNAMRHQYRVLSDGEKASMMYIKDAGQALIDTIRGQAPEGRERSLAITKVEEAVMWAVKGLTA